MNEERLVNDRCPDEWTLSRFLENRLDDANAGAVLAHVAGCANCRAKVKGLADWLGRTGCDEQADELQALARKAWLRSQWRRVAERFKPEAVFRAAADGQTADHQQTKTALGSGFIHFLSRTPRGQRDGWHVKLSIPSSPTEKTKLRLAVMDGTDAPVPKGTLYFCGLTLSVNDGHAFMSLVDFQRNMGEAVISLRRDGVSDVPGDPVLGYDLMT